MNRIDDSDNNTGWHRKPITEDPGSHPVGTGVGAAKAVIPTAEDEYWRVNYLERDYVERSRPYADYRSAYRYGWESRARLGTRAFRDVERDLEIGWDKAKGESKLAWSQAKLAVSDAWHRIGHA